MNGTDRPARRLPKVIFFLLIPVTAVVAMGCSSARRTARADKPWSVFATRGPGFEIKRRAYLHVQTEKITPIYNKAMAVAQRHKAFLVSADQDTLNLRVPAASLSRLLIDLSKLGKVKDRWIKGRAYFGGTAQVRSRIDQLRQRIRRTEGQLARARGHRQRRVYLQRLTWLRRSLASLQQQEVAHKGTVDYVAFRYHISKPVKPGPIGWVFYGLFLVVKKAFVWSA